MKEFCVYLLLVCGLCTVRAQTKMEKLKAVPEFSEFVKAVEALKQEANLENRNIQTVLVPVNDAFTAASQSGQLGATDNEKNLCLQTHMLSGDAFTSAHINGKLNVARKILKADTKRGGEVYFTKFNNSNHVDTAQMIGPEDQWTANGFDYAIQGIDRVLCPYFPLKLFNQDPSIGSFLKDKSGTVMNEMFISFLANDPGANLLSQVGYGGTFLVPTDTALKEANVEPYLQEALTELKKPEHVTQMEKILETHVIDGQVLKTLVPGEIQPYHQGSKITVTTRQLNGQNIVTLKAGETEAQVEGEAQLIGNGIVFYINRILNFFYMNNYALIMTNPHTAQFKELFSYADETVKISLKDGSKNYTVFAVDDLGIKGNDKLTKMRSDKPALTKALEMAIVPDKAYSLADLKGMDGQKIPTQNGDVEVKVNGEEVSIIGGGVTARIVKADLKTTNGMVHILDQMLSVGSTTVYDALGKDSKLKYLLDLFDQFGFGETLKTAKNITVIGANEDTFKEARENKPELEKLLKDTSNTNEAYVQDMKNFLSVFILQGLPDIALGMDKTNLETFAYGTTRMVGFQGSISGVQVMYKGQTVDLNTPYKNRAANGQYVVSQDVLVDVKDIKTGQVLGAATAKLHTGLALLFTLVVLKFWL